MCQKKGVLVIKKVSPNTDNVHFHGDKTKYDSTEKDKEADPFEFKSSQKTPIIPESKRNRNVKKQQKDKLKGKLDFKNVSNGKGCLILVTSI